MAEYYDEHYAKMKEQPIEKMQRGYRGMTHEMFLGFLLGSSIKYEDRAGLKKGEPKEKDEAKKKRYDKWFDKASRGEYIDPTKD